MAQRATQLAVACAALSLVTPGVRADLVEQGTGRLLLDNVVSGSFFWPTRDVTAARLTTVNDTDIDRFCDLHSAWMEGDDALALDPDFAAKFRDSFVLFPSPIPCYKLWSERNAIAPLAILNTSVIVFATNKNVRPVPMSYFHDGDKYASVKDILEPLQWLATNADVNATALREEILALPEGQQAIEVSITVDPNPWLAEFQSLPRRASFGFCAALLVANSFVAIRVFMERRKLSKRGTSSQTSCISIPNVVLGANVFVNLFLGVVLIGMNGFRIYSVLSLNTLHLFATAFHSTTTACSFLLVVFWNHLVKKSIGGAKKAGCLPDSAIVAIAAILFALDWLAGVMLRSGMSPGLVFGIVALLSAIFQLTSLFTLNRATWAALQLMRGSAGAAKASGSKQIAILVKRIAILIRIASVSGIASGLGAFLYAQAIHSQDTPAALLNFDLLIVFAGAINRCSQILVFWPVRDASKSLRKSRVSHSQDQATGAASTVTTTKVIST